MVSLITLSTLLASQLLSSTSTLANGSNYSKVSLAIVSRQCLAQTLPQNTTNATSVEWGPCDPSVITNPALTCAFFEIPLDYHDLSAGYGRLALAKLSATGERRGTAFINPGMFDRTVGSASKFKLVLTSRCMQVAQGARVWRLSMA